MKITKIKEFESLLENISAKKFYSSQNIELIEITLKKSQKIPSHKNNVDALFHIIEGNGILRIDNNEYKLTKGDFLKISKNENREWENNGDGDLVITVTKIMN